MATQTITQTNEVALGEILKKIFRDHSNVFSYREIRMRLNQLGISFSNAELEGNLKRLIHEDFLISGCVCHKISPFSREEWCLIKFWKD